MKITTIALATVFSLTSTLALAQTTGTEGYGSVVAPSVGSYQFSVGSTNEVPTWRNTGPAASLPSSMDGSAFGNAGASIGHAHTGWFPAPEVRSAPRITRSPHG
jgi:hypothetical protein